MTYETLLQMQPHQLIAISTGALLALHLSLFIVAVVLSWCWNWINDTREKAHLNWYGRIIMCKVLGFKCEEHGYYVYKKYDSNGCSHSQDSDCFLAVVPFSVIVIAIPTIIYVLLTNLWLLGTITTITAIMWVARLAVRQQKMLKSHIEDKEAHK